MCYTATWPRSVDKEALKYVAADAPHLTLNVANHAAPTHSIEQVSETRLNGAGERRALRSDMNFCSRDVKVEACGAPQSRSHSTRASQHLRVYTRDLHTLHRS